MFKIGEFSRLSRIPVKTLRYYHDIGLLRAAAVDFDSSYRYYGAEQLVRLNHILALKELGFGLDEIGRILDDDLTPEQLRGMLRMKRAELERSLHAEQARLARIEARLQWIERESKMPTYEVITKQVDAMTVAGCRGIAANYSSVGPLFEELFGALGRHHLAPAGPPMGIYFDEEYKEKDVDVEAAVPIAGGSLPAEGAVRVHELPATLVASVMRKGPYDDFTPAYQALMEWIAANGYRIAGPNRELYLVGPEAGVPPGEYLTEIQFPVARSA